MRVIGDSGDAARRKRSFASVSNQTGSLHLGRLYWDSRRQIQSKFQLTVLPIQSITYVIPASHQTRFRTTDLAQGTERPGHTCWV